MASLSFNLFFLTLLVATLYMGPITIARPISKPKPESSLAVRLQSNGSSSSTECWDSLGELKSCTGEVILFFLNGETYLGPNCCRAIRIIEHQCWPAMLGALGFTPEEGDILRGYCDSDASPVPPVLGHPSDLN